ncbi:MAG: hypothetical protein QXD84_03765, partial [Thermoplasmata archaeon]
HPQSNGKVKKAAGTMMRLIRHFGRLERALSYYNYRRPHWSLRLEECETPFQAFIRKMWPVKRRAFIRENIKMVARYAPAYLLEEGFTVERGSGTWTQINERNLIQDSTERLKIKRESPD